MTAHAPPAEGFVVRVEESFRRQRVMALLGASLASVEPGRVQITMPFREDLTQQHGYLHAGIVGTLADSAGGFAAQTLLPAGSGVLALEYKLHFLAPARGESFLATGRVVRAGRTITVCELQVEALLEGARAACAYGTQTLLRVERAERA